MSALARYFKFKGLEVAGYDRTRSELTCALEAEGIDVHYEDDPSRIPPKEGTLVIYTPAIPQDLAEFRRVLSAGYEVVKRSKALGHITKGQCCLAVAGTHGKTTTSTLVAHILTESGEGCSAFLGGISCNYGTNMLMSKTPVVVAEADEFDRSFLQLHPSIAAITAMDADHLDIYGDLAHVQDAFRAFSSQVSETLILKYGLPLNGTSTGARIFTYHFDDPRADFHAQNIRPGEDGHYTYDLAYPSGVLTDIRVGTIGWVNVENSIAAAAICLCHGLDAQKVRRAIGTFKGARRRLEEHVNTPSAVYIDDYAHHPEELRAAISSIRGVFPGKKLTAVFQPHLYTRTRDFAPEFAEALSAADKVVLLSIYPAREEPIEGVSERLIFDRLTCPEKELTTLEGLPALVERERPELLVTFGAGSIDKAVAEITGIMSRIG